MFEFIFSILTQALTFIPLAIGISISYHVLRATDMTIDGSFVLGAAVFARLVTLGSSPIIAFFLALLAGALAGSLTSFIQRNGKVDSLLAGVLATFILSSVNLIIMGKPNIGLLNATTLVSNAFVQSEAQGWILIASIVACICIVIYFIFQSIFGLKLRAFGDNPELCKRLGNNVERYRIYGFALTNLLGAASGCLTAQIVGYADIGMGFGMTLTGIGAIILGQQLLQKILRHSYFRIGKELIACLLGVLIYFFALNALFRADINPIYLKMLLGILLALFLRVSIQTRTSGVAK